MAALTYAQRASFCTTVAELLKSHAAELKAGGFDVTAKTKAISDAHATYVTADAFQEGKKAELVKATEAAVAALDKVYRAASNAADGMVSAVGKESPLGQRIRKLRGEMTQAAKKVPATVGA
ncbi:MAG: hypothetical protein IT452_19755 [Planctomycetia bacterium]|nr:hypothetical protein [Planctomycetia bacterium]